MNRTNQTGAPAGQYARLSDGLSHRRREGSPDGLPVVLVHGATVPPGNSMRWSRGCCAQDFRPCVSIFMDTAHLTGPRAHTPSSDSRGRSSRSSSRRLSHGLRCCSGIRSVPPVGGRRRERPDLAARLVLVAPMLDFSSSSGAGRSFSLSRRRRAGDAFHRRTRPDTSPAPPLRGHRPATSHAAIHRAGYVRGFRAWTAVDVPDRRARRSERALFGAGRARRDVLVITGDHDNNRFPPNTCPRFAHRRRPTRTLRSPPNTICCSLIPMTS